MSQRFFAALLFLVGVRGVASSQSRRPGLSRAFPMTFHRSVTRMPRSRGRRRPGESMGVLPRHGGERSAGRSRFAEALYSDWISARLHLRSGFRGTTDRFRDLVNTCVEINFVSARRSATSLPVPAHRVSFFADYRCFNQQVARAFLRFSLERGPQGPSGALSGGYSREAPESARRHHRSAFQVCACRSERLLSPDRHCGLAHLRIFPVPSCRIATSRD